jgi:hypothetical protein
MTKYDMALKMAALMHVDAKSILAQNTIPKGSGESRMK